jgi:hypothetical protein
MFAFFQQNVILMVYLVRHCITEACNGVLFVITIHTPHQIGMVQEVVSYILHLMFLRMSLRFGVTRKFIGFGIISEEISTY